MPLIRQDALPVTREELNEIRTRLDKPYAFEIVTRGDESSLFLHSPNDEPDPITDLEEGLERIPDWIARKAPDVYLLGTRGSFHIPASNVRPILQERARLDAVAVEILRGEADSQYGISLQRINGDPLNRIRLGLRLPRAQIAEIREADLLRIAETTGPLTETGESDRVRIAYLIADQDHLRLTGTELFEDVTPRWHALQRDREQARPDLQASKPNETGRLLHAPRVRARPKRVRRVTPAFEITTEIPAATHDQASQSQLDIAVDNLRQQLQLREFQAIHNVEHEGQAFAIAAERIAGYPRRLAVVAYSSFTRTDAERLLRLVRALEADLILAIANEASDDALRRCLATKVKVLRPHEVTLFQL